MVVCLKFRVPLPEGLALPVEEWRSAIQKQLEKVRGLEEEYESTMASKKVYVYFILFRLIFFFFFCSFPLSLSFWCPCCSLFFVLLLFSLQLQSFPILFLVLKGNIPRISSYTWLFAINTGWFVVLRSNP